MFQAASNDRERFVELSQIDGETKESKEVYIHVERVDGGASRITVRANLPGVGSTGPIAAHNYEVAAMLAHSLMRASALVPLPTNTSARS